MSHFPTPPTRLSVSRTCSARARFVFPICFHNANCINRKEFMQANARKLKCVDIPTFIINPAIMVLQTEAGMHRRSTSSSLFTDVLMTDELNIGSEEKKRIVDYFFERAPHAETRPRPRWAWEGARACRMLALSSSGSLRIDAHCFLAPRSTADNTIQICPCILTET